MTKPRYIGTPEPGFYKRRLTKGGPWVAVRFFTDDEALRVEVDGYTTDKEGRPLDPHAVWPLCWPSSESEYHFFVGLREWARKHRPDHPAARPHAPINLNALPPRRRP